MSAKQSNLSDSHYGYDFVVATTEASINATLKEFLSKPDAKSWPDFAGCWVAAADGADVLVDHDEFARKAGVDPFGIPADTDPSDERIGKLVAAKFRYGFSACSGLPPGVPPRKVADLVRFLGEAESVAYTALFARFRVVELDLDKDGKPAAWRRTDQASGVPWLVTTQVNLHSAAVAAGEVDQLPKVVRDQVGKLKPDTFGVRQLLFDLEQVGPKSVIEVKTGEPDDSWLNGLLRKVFTGGFYKKLTSAQQPVVGYGITRSNVPAGTPEPTSLDLVISPYLEPGGGPAKDDKGLSTLVYLCATDGNRLPHPEPFAWNWLEEADRADANGAIAVNRAGLTKYLYDRLLGYVRWNCLDVHAHAKSGWTKVTFSWSADAGQSPKVQAPPTGPEVLTFDWSDRSYDEAWGEGSLTLETSFSLNVVFDGDTIVIDQRLVVYVRAKVNWNKCEGNVVDKRITDTYTLAVDQNGRLAPTLKSALEDKSEDIKNSHQWKIFGNLDKLVDNVATWASQVASSGFHDLSLDLVQDYVFPGGRAFTLKSAGFSEHQDLISLITYVAPEADHG